MRRRKLLGSDQDHRFSADDHFAVRHESPRSLIFVEAAPRHKGIKETTREIASSPIRAKRHNDWIPIE